MIGLDALAVVTGAGSGIGRATAIELSKLGLEVVLVGRRWGALNETAEIINARNGRASVCTCDLTLSDEIGNLSGNVEHMSLGRKVRVLVHSAALFSHLGFKNLCMDEFDAIFRANVRTPYSLIHALLRQMGKGSDIVILNSSAARQAQPSTSAYAASKAALEMLTDNLRQEVNPSGIRVMSVFPGRTATPMQEQLFASEGREYKPEVLLQPEDVAKVIVHAIQLPETAEVTELHIRPAKKG